MEEERRKGEEEEMAERREGELESRLSEGQIERRLEQRLREAQVEREARQRELIQQVTCRFNICPSQQLYVLSYGVGAKRGAGGN